MDNQQALQVLYQAAGQAPLTREGHEQVKQAAVTLQKALEPEKEKKKK